MTVSLGTTPVFMPARFLYVERNLIVKKICLIGVLLLAVVMGLVACDAGKSSETPTTSQIGEVSSACATEVLDETSAELSEPAGTTDREPETIPDEPVEESTLLNPETTEADEVPADSDAESEDVTEEMTLESSADVTADSSEDVTEIITLPPDTELTTEEATQPPESEETQPGKLVYSYNESLTYLDNMGETIGTAFDMGGYSTWKRTITVGKDQVAVILDEGWAAFSSKGYQFGYIVNGASFFSDTYAREAETSVKDMAAMMGATNCARYCGGLTVEALQLGENTVKFCVILDGGVLCYLRDYIVTLSDKPVNIDGTYWSVDIDTWTVSGHNPTIQDSSNGMVAAGGVDKGALLHQGAVGIGTVDLSKYNKVIVYWGCDASGVTQNHYNNNANNRVIVTKADSNGKMSPDEKDILAFTTYTLHGWRSEAIEIDLTGVNYNGPVYITIDSLPGTFVLVSAIELYGSGKPDGTVTPTPPVEKDYVPPVSEWEVSGHKKGVTPASDPTHGAMVAAGGVSEGALLHQGAVGVGTVDLSKYSKVVVYYGCDASGVTQNHYNESAHNRIMLTSADTDGKNSPDAGDIIAATTYTLRGWGVTAIEIDLTGVNYNGPVYVSVDTLPGTFMLISSIEFIV